jgi:hypothetical protein
MDIMVQMKLNYVILMMCLVIHDYLARSFDLGFHGWRCVDYT